ncbi:penicillin-binding protein 2 [PVC group bacterium (ex Bugula neritina AB1)]|nr:penicillin-binding protein 2 [PVC group bacterium (ex Bugula neritina AB1)]
MKEMRLYTLWFTISLAQFFLIFHIWKVQIKKGDKYWNLSEGNRIKHIPLEAPRGDIYDRNNKLLVKTRASFDIFAIPKELKRHPQSIKLLAKIMNVDIQNIWKKIRKRKRSPFVAQCFFKDISKKQMFIIEENALQLPGIFLKVTPKRKYIHGKTAAHVLGYVGEVNNKDLKDLYVYGYSFGSLIGKMGIEKTYEPYLRGKKGGVQMEVNALGQERHRLGHKPPEKGKDLILTLDLDIQKIAEKKMAKHRGAVIVMNPKTSEVLAMVSQPSFDPNVFVEKSRLAELKKLLKNRKERPLLNRALGASFSPGSIFKIFVGLTGLKEKKITPAFKYTCSGSHRIGRLFHCWNKHGHGEVNLSKAIQTSCNVYFYKLSQTLPIDTWVKYTKRFGFGKKTGIDLPHEKNGFVPDKMWKYRRFKEKWYRGETANFSIGQGYLLVTPLQLLTSVNIVINGGEWIQPYFVKTIKDGNKKSYDMEKPQKKNLNFSYKILESVRKGMKDVVNDPRGSGQRAFLKDIVVSGKTGTVELISRERKKKFGSKLPKKYENHAWFSGYAPFDNPQVSLIIFLENGKSGGRYAAKVAHDILKDIFELPSYSQYKKV